MTHYASVEKAMATQSSTLAWKIPWTEEPGRLQIPWGHKELDTTERLHFTSDICVVRMNAQNVFTGRGIQ